MKKRLLNLTSYQTMQIEQKEHKMVYLSDYKRRMKMCLLCDGSSIKEDTIQTLKLQMLVYFG